MDSVPRITSALKKSIFLGIAVSTRYLNIARLGEEGYIWSKMSL